MNLVNEWIGYVERGYEQMMAAIIARMPTYVPEITDYSDSNPWMKAVRIWCGIGEQLGYYLDTRAREVFLPTARNYASAVRFAALVDYRIRGVLPATVDLVFSLGRAEAVPTYVPAGTAVRTLGGLTFYTLTTVVIAAGLTQVTAPAANWVRVPATALGVSTGAAGQRFALASGVVDSNIVVTVGSSPVVWEPVDTLAFSNGAAAVFRASQNEQQVLEISFGDNTNGLVPGPGLPVSAAYYTSDGAVGNVGENTLTEVAGLVSPGGQTVRVTNPQRAAGGADAEGLETLRKRIPLSLRTLDRAVTEQDYIDVALLAPGVAQAGVEYSCGKTVTVYVAPEGGGVASSALLAGVGAYFEPRRMITTKVQAVAAGEVHLLLTAFLQVKPNYNRAATLATATARILDFLSVKNQQINGSVELGDVYQVFEDTEGVEFSRISLLTPRPYARPVGTATVLAWTVAVQPESRATATWRLTVQPDGQFELLRNSTYEGLFAAGTLQIFDEVEFTVQADPAYQSGDSWEFVTYPYSGSLYLAEKSVPVTTAADLTLTAAGGL